MNKIIYRASIIGILIMIAFDNIKYKASIISILIMLALNNVKYKASIIGILIMPGRPVNPIQTRGQILPTISLDFWRMLHLCIYCACCSAHKPV